MSVPAVPDTDCEGELVWPNEELKNGTELLRCTMCGTEIPGSILRLTRQSARTNPATGHAQHN